jgi:murein DD-endopeptidase MepM/ murein hydrolase activator NlpD
MQSNLRINKSTGLKKLRQIHRHLTMILVSLVLVLTGCIPSAPGENPAITPIPDQPAARINITPLPTREKFKPGELVDYTVQNGDTVVALAARFNTTVNEIQTSNPVLPQTTTTLPPGLPLKIPIYYLPLWGSPYHILPDALFVNGPAQIGFDTIDFVSKSNGWLKNFRIYAYEGWRTGAELVDYIGMSYSVSPRLLLALLEYQTQALTNPTPPEDIDRYPLGFKKVYNENLYLQLLMAADTLNAGYYGWREGSLLSVDLQDGKLMRFDPWLNASSVSLQNYFSIIYAPDEFEQAISSEGLAATYRSLFGQLPTQDPELIPGSLTQPALQLPFTPNKVWSYTGGPHPVWGVNQPWAAIDFAPPADRGGCTISTEWVTAVADGVLSRTEVGLTILDLDGDGDERTGWVVLYLHLDRVDAAPQGKAVKAGDVLGHPSCERGIATGTHVHIARKYNGEWIPADGPLAFDLEGWIVHSSGTAYIGTLTRFGQTLIACTCSDAQTQLETGK